MTWDELVEIMARKRLDRAMLGKPTQWGDLTDDERDILLNEERAALSAIREAGVRLMPAEVTEEMQRCGGAVLDHPSVYMGGASFRSIKSATAVYRAMLAAGEIKPEGGK